MADPSLFTTVTDVQRNRAAEYLQQVYASGVLSDELFEQRLGIALAAQTRAGLDTSLQGLAWVAGMFPSTSAVQHPVHEGMQNLAAGFFHLATLPTMFLAPAIARALASPRSCIATEASRAMCFQFNALIYGAIAVILVFSNWVPPILLFLGFIAWGLMTLWLAIRSVTGEKSTTIIERLVLMHPPKGRRWCRMDYAGSYTTQEGMAGFDLGGSSKRSGPRIHACLANAVWEPISASNSRTDFTLAV